MDEPAAVSIRNPFVGVPGYGCFGCAPSNDAGLHMEFSERGDAVECRWNPLPHFQGYHDVLHGGVQATLMDETASWYVFVKLGTSGVTSGLNARYEKPIRVADGEVLVSAKLERMEGRVATIRTEIRDASGRVCTFGSCEYTVFPETVARKRLSYPGREAFY